MKSTHHCVGLYLPDGPHLDREFYREILSWFKAKDCTVDTIGLGPYFRGYRQFSRVRKTIEQFDLESANSLELNSHAEGAKNQFDDCKLDVILSQRTQTFAISSRSDIYPRGPETLALLMPIIERLEPEYGIGFTRNFFNGPTWYVVGYQCNKPTSNEDADNCRGWTNYGLPRYIWRHGQIRDVYPWNFLNRSQLQARVGKATLKQWIEAGPHRGALQPVGADLVLWDVPEADIPPIRPILRDAGVIFDHHPIEEELIRNMAPMSEQDAMHLALGGRNPEDVRVVKSLGGGRLRRLNTEEVKQLARKESRKKQ